MNIAKSCVVMLVALGLVSCAETRYRKVAIYCPSAPDREVDSVTHVFRHRDEIIVSYEINGERYGAIESPSCTVRTLEVYPNGN